MAATPDPFTGVLKEAMKLKTVPKSDNMVEKRFQKHGNKNESGEVKNNPSGQSEMISPPSIEKQGRSESQSSPSSPANETEDLKRRVKLQEKLIREQLGQNLKKIKQESKKLAVVQKALEELEREQQRDIDILRISKNVLYILLKQYDYIFLLC